MIALIEKIIREKLLSEINVGVTLDFLRFCTPTSGSALNDKVIFLIFRRGDSSPFLCVKTTRNYAARDVVVKNFQNLSMLHKLVSKTSFENLFSLPLFLYDDGENIFSAERTCLGRRARDSIKDISFIIKQYGAWQSLSAKNVNDFVDDISACGSALVEKTALSQEIKKELVEYLFRLPASGSFQLPKVIQHGDLTLDNILIRREQISVIDYDYVGISFIPGFDIWSLLYRALGKNFKNMHKSYFDDFYRSMGIHIDNYKAIFYIFYLTELALKKKHLLQNTGSNRIIGNFEAMFVD